MPLCGIAAIIIVGFFIVIGILSIGCDSKKYNSDNTKGNKNTSKNIKQNTIGDSIKAKRRLTPLHDGVPGWNSPLTGPDLQEEMTLYSNFVENPNNKVVITSFRDFPMYAQIFAAGLGYRKECIESLDVDSDSNAFKIFAKYARLFVGIGDSGFPDEFYRTFGDALYVRFLCEKTEFYSHLETLEFSKCKQDLDQVLGTFKGIAKKIARVTPYPGFSYNSENEEMKRNLEEFIKSSKDVVDLSVDVFNSLVDEHNVLTEKLICEENRKKQEERAMSQKSTEEEIVATLSAGASRISGGTGRKDLNSPVW